MDESEQLTIFKASSGNGPFAPTKKTAAPESRNGRLKKAKPQNGYQL